jgi:hypothetical protein
MTNDPHNQLVMVMEYLAIVYAAASIIERLSPSDGDIACWVTSGDDSVPSGYYPEGPAIVLRWDDFRGQWTEELVQALVENYLAIHRGDHGNTAQTGIGG